MSRHGFKPPEPINDLVEGTDLEYLKSDDLYFSLLRNKLGNFESTNQRYVFDKRVETLEPFLNQFFKKQVEGQDHQNSSSAISADRSILDIGCGDGNFVISMNLKYFIKSSEGIDISSKKLKVAIQNLKMLKQKSETEENQYLYREIKQFYYECPKNLIYEKDKKLFEMFFQNTNPDKVTEDKNRIKKMGMTEGLDFLKSQRIIFKLQNVFNFQSVEKFDFVFCLRMTKWIFLSVGEDALKIFLEKSIQLVNDTGFLVVSKVHKKKFKNTARIVHKLKNSTHLWLVHNNIIKLFMAENRLIEINTEAVDKNISANYQILTRDDNQMVCGFLPQG